MVYIVYIVIQRSNPRHVPCCCLVNYLRPRCHPFFSLSGWCQLSNDCGTKHELRCERCPPRPSLHRQAAKSNGLFSPVGRILGVSTNGDAPTISSLTVVPVDARTNATEMLLSMDAPSVPCRVWYTILPLRDTVHLGVERFSAQEIAEVAQPDSIIDLPQASFGILVVDSGSRFIATGTQRVTL